jgi:hypothetical protein
LVVSCPPKYEILSISILSGVYSTVLAKVLRQKHRDTGTLEVGSYL